MYLSYKKLTNHQQIVSSLDEIVHKPFFDVDFSVPVFRDGIVKYIEDVKNSCETARGVEISTKTGLELINTHCTACHYNLCNVTKSFVDVQLWRKLKLEEQKNYKLFADWLLSMSDDNPWSAAVSQLIIVTDPETGMIDAVIQPTISNIPDKALFCNFIIALRMGTEGDTTVIPEFFKLVANGLSKRAAFFIACKKLWNTNHPPFAYITAKTPAGRYLSEPSFYETGTSKMSSKCNEKTWCHAEGVILTDEYLNEKEKV